MPGEPDRLRSLAAPRYHYAEADRLAGVSRGTSRRWLEGHTYRGSEGALMVRPLVMVREGTPRAVSFIDLVEIAAVGRLRERGFSLRQIREIAENCRTHLGVERPFPALRFKVAGGDAFVDHPENLPEMGRRRGQLAWTEVLEPFLQDLDYSFDVASRWWPMGRGCPVVIDPEYGFGLPVVAGSGVRTEILLERFQAGDLSQQIAEDFNLDPVEVERALQFELARAA